MVNQSGYSNSAIKEKQYPKTSQKEMTNVEKGMVIAFFSYLRNIALVAQTIGWPWSTIESFLTGVCEHQSLDNMLRPSRPPVFSQGQHHIIIRAAKSNLKMTRSNFQDKYGPGIC